jgi:RNA polymerase sigma factor (TIGR02999 family)
MLHTVVRGWDKLLGRMATTDAISQLMGRFRQGDRQAAGELVEIFYPQLRQIASRRMGKEAAGHTWQTTALVNELYLELLKIRSLQAADPDDEAEREAFLKLCSHLMRRLLIHHVRPLSKRVGRGELPDDLLDAAPGLEGLQEIDELLDRLSQVNPAVRSVVEMRIFEGLNSSEIADRLACSTRSVDRHWNFARMWLAEEMGAPVEP